jgi:2-C-methyl-D-erythritol 2,4-cyclodiphosphate synthase
MELRVGYGYDVHALIPGRDFWLGGVKIEHEKGLLGHSDADVLIHALCDALLGAAGMRDIGYQFPDTSTAFKDIDSKKLLAETRHMLADKRWRVMNMDATVCLQRPRISPFIPAMQSCLAELLQIEAEAVSIKATTSEGLGFAGREEGVWASAVVLIYR